MFGSLEVGTESIWGGSRSILRVRGILGEVRELVDSAGLENR